MEFDLNAPAVIADPYPFYERLRDEAPVLHLADLDLWVLSRYEDVERVLRDAASFSSDLAGLAKGMRVNPFHPGARIPRATALAFRLPRLRVLLTSDAPEHTVLRRKVSRAFTPRTMASWEPRIRSIAEKLVDDLASKGPGPVDLVAHLASPLPTTVIAELMGIPPERHRDFKRWSDNLVNALVANGSRLRFVASLTEISQFFAGAVRQRRKQPGDDLVSVLVTGDPENRLNTLELILFCILLLVAGNETTTNLVANAMLALFARPELLRKLEADPTLAAAVIEETLRYDSPGQGLIRVTTVDVTFGAVTIPAGSKVLPLVGSANRDPRHWRDPADFLPGREPNDHLGFGAGVHFCIGSALARLEGTVALETLARRLSDLSPAGEPERITSPVLRGLRSLPVNFARK
jgi:cytochrome P450